MAILKKLKRGLKKAAKVAIPVGAALLAAKAMKRRNANVEMDLPKSDIVRTTLNKMTSNDAYNDDTMPGMLSRNMGMKPKRRNMYSPNDFGLGPYDGAKDGGRIGKKSGGKVKGGGKALRGLGRAFTKGRK